MLTILKIQFNKKITSLLICLFLSNLLSLTGCATMGAKLATHIAEKDERKDCADTYGEKSFVDQETCERITRLIKKVTKEENGGFVAYDKFGRLTLKGTYENEDELALAHMIVLTIVGTSGAGISSVTPRNLKEIKLVKSYVPQQSYGGRGEKFALLVGVSKFQNAYHKKKNPKGIKPIETAVEDVKALKESLIASGFKKDNIIELIDEKATKAGILYEMSKLQEKVTSPNDSVVLYISTHGTPPDTYGKMGIIPYNMNSKVTTGDMQAEATKASKGIDGDDAVIQIAKARIESLKTAVSFDDIQDFITDIKTDKFVTILDTCYSGSALPALSPLGGKQYVDREENASQSLGAEQKSELLGGSKAQECALSEYPDNMTKKLSTTFGSINNSGTKSMYSDESYNEQPSIAANHQNINQIYMYDEFEKLKAAFSNADNIPQQGKVLVTATNGKQESLFDMNKLPNSFFTFYLTEGLKRFNGQIFKAFDYAKVRTSTLVAQSQPGKNQTPEMTGVPEQCINIDLKK